jgi:hypothetical protein
MYCSASRMLSMKSCLVIVAMVERLSALMPG